MNYICDENTIIIDPEFNEELSSEYLSILSNYKHVVFSGYKLCKSLLKKYKNNECINIGGKFNKPIDKLPNSITHLTFGYNFNQPVDNLPNSITHLTIGSCFNQPVVNLPKNINYIECITGV